MEFKNNDRLLHKLSPPFKTRGSFFLPRLRKKATRRFEILKRTGTLTD